MTSRQIYIQYIKLVQFNLHKIYVNILYIICNNYVIICIFKDFEVLYSQYLSSWEPGNIQCFQEKVGISMKC